MWSSLYYPESPGTTDDINTFLHDSRWIFTALQAPSGQTSYAMLDMVKRLRELREEGYDLSVTTFVRATSANQESQTPYEKGLAESLIEAELNGDYDLVMVLVGNVHASKSVVDFGTPFEPMVMHLPQDATLSLNLQYTGGSAWNCRPDCRMHEVGEASGDPAWEIILGNEGNNSYDGVFNVGIITASPPVLDPQ